MISTVKESWIARTRTKTPEKKKKTSLDKHPLMQSTTAQSKRTVVTGWPKTTWTRSTEKEMKRRGRARRGVEW